MKRKILSIFLALMLLCTLLPTTVVQAAREDWVPYAVEGGNLYFDPATGEIVGCGGRVTSAVIPSQIGGVPVTGIGNDAFSWENYDPDRNPAPGEPGYAEEPYQGGASLKSVTIPDSVRRIGLRAFSHCRKLERVVMQDGVTSIGDYAFSDCDSLTNMTLPGSVTQIGSFVFLNCYGLTEIELQDGIPYLGMEMFGNCTGLKGVTIPDSVTNIGIGAFRGCGALTITIPDSVTSIEDEAFSDCDGLTQLTIPDSVTSIGYGAFCGCDVLAQITIPDSVTSLGDHLFVGCYNLTSVRIPDGVTGLGDEMFQQCASLTQVELPNGLTKIGVNAFRDCTALAKIAIPDTVTQIGGFAFYNCTALRNITIPDGVTKLEGSTFYGCTALTYAVLPKSITQFGLWEFGDSGLQDVYYAGSADDWGQITIARLNEVLTGATFHYNSTGPAEPEEPVYTVTVAPSVHGRVAATPLAAEAGTRITLTVTPDEGYRLQSLTVRSSTGAQITPEQADGIYTFSMPESDVTVTAAFEQLPVKNYTVTVAPADHGGVTADPVIAEAGTKITLTVTPDEGYALESLTVRGSAGAQITPEQAGGTYTFSMPESNVTVTAVFRRDRNLDLSALTYPFGNTAAAFGYPEKYRIPLSSYQIIYGETELARQHYEEHPLWGGSCFGMTTTSGMFFEDNDVNVADFNESATVPYDLEVTDRNEDWDLTLTTFIEAMHVSQYDVQIQHDFAANTNRLDALCTAVQNSHSTASRPVVICIYGSKTDTVSGHAVIGYDLQEVSDTQSHLMVYDPNFPNTERYITLTKNAAGQYVGWYYHHNNAHDWGTDDPFGSITYIPYSDYYAEWKNRPQKPETDQTIVSLNTEDARIYGADGQTVATVEDGEVRSARDDVYPMRQMDLSADGTGPLQIWLPTGLYTVKNEDATVETFEVSVVHVDQSATVSTSGDTVTFAVNDPTQVDYACVEGAGETYRITLGSTLAQGHDAVELSGTTTGEQAALAQIAGKLYATGAEEGVSLRVDGAAADTGSLAGEVPDIPGALSGKPVTPDKPDTPVTFTDVPADASYADAVSWAVSKNITNGTSEGKFSPLNNCTRGQIVTFLWRANNSPKPTQTSHPFTDVDPDAYYYDAMLWAVEKGITTGTSATTFSPNAPCTRGQAVTFLHRAANRPVATAANTFTDVQSGAYYYDAVLWAVEKGITNGTTATTFGPDKTCTRGHIVTFLYRNK